MSQLMGHSFRAMTVVAALAKFHLALVSVERGLPASTLSPAPHSKVPSPQPPSIWSAKGEATNALSSATRLGKRSRWRMVSAGKMGDRDERGEAGRTSRCHLVYRMALGARAFGARTGGARLSRLRLREVLRPADWPRTSDAPGARVFEVAARHSGSLWHLQPGHLLGGPHRGRNWCPRLAPPARCKVFAFGDKRFR